jgi:ATP-dependent Clp protease ATP-binding subunit ClpB
MQQLRLHFRPEFLNRVDDIVLFKPLSSDELKQIVDLQLEQIRKRLKDRNIQLDLTDSAKTFIAEASYDPVYGARPLRRYLQQNLETRIGRAIVAGHIQDGSVVTVTSQNGNLEVQTHAGV